MSSEYNEVAVGCRAETIVRTTLAEFQQREREKFICMKKTAGNQKGKCPSTLVPILNQIINN